jgi:hypothetical protein
MQSGLPQEYIMIILEPEQMDRTYQVKLNQEDLKSKTVVKVFIERTFVHNANMKKE